MADENKDDDNNLEALFASAEMPNEMTEAWILYHEMYKGLLSGGFERNEALTILTNLMWRMMQEGGQ